MLKIFERRTAEYFISIGAYEVKGSHKGHTYKKNLYYKKDYIDYIYSLKNLYYHTGEP